MKSHIINRMPGVERADKGGNMKRFARAFAVTFGIVGLGSFVALIPQKNATATGGAPVNIMSPLPLPVTGSVNAVVSGTVGVNNLPTTQNVSVTNPSVPVSGRVGISGNVRVVNVTGSFGSSPLVTIDALDSPAAPFQRELCTFAGVAPPPFLCESTPNAFQVPDDARENPQRLVIEYVSGNCAVSPSIQGGFVARLTTVAGGQQVRHKFAVVSNGSMVVTFGQRTKIYADPDSQVLIDAFQTGALSLACDVAVSGYLVSPTL